MSEALSYHDDLIEQGYSEEEAVEHTKRYFPDFSLDGKKPDPAPPPGFEFIPSEKDDAEKSPQTSFNLDKVLFKAGLLFDNAKLSVKENKKVVYSICGAIVALLVIYMVLQIPASTHPIEGSWIKSDGQVFTFNMDGSFEDGTDNDAEWEIDGDSLTITSTIKDGGDSVEVIQTLKQEFSSDEDAMWIKWIGLSIDGQDATSEVENTCILLIKDSNSYSEDAGEYISKSPSWCE
tara:strand:- start:1586 stop:2287 length:702 start_codon:yes stop_codon:yes gene_type:complete